MATLVVPPTPPTRAAKSSFEPAAPAVATAPGTVAGAGAGKALASNKTVGVERGLLAGTAPAWGAIADGARAGCGGVIASRGTGGATSTCEGGAKGRGSDAAGAAFCGLGA